jgi:putative ABC transport system permease protein
VAVLTLALSIGANTAIFSFADVIIRRPISLPQLGRLVAASEVATGSEDTGVSPANFWDLRAECHSLSDLAAYQTMSAALTGQGEAEKLNGVAVTANFFSTIGVQPALGRGFLPEEEQSGKDRVLVLSDAFWRQRFGGRTNILGQTVSLDGEPYKVVGVMPPKFAFPLGRHAFWRPLAIVPGERESRTDLNLDAIGLLAPEATLNQARSELEIAWTRLSQQYPQANAGRSLRVTTLRDQVVLDYNRQFAFLLMGVVGFVLLIACANIGNLQLGRAARRAREVAVRSALGAGRYRIAAQFLTESVLLAAIGGLLGIFVALWGVSILHATLPPQVEEICDLNNLGVNGTAMFFTLGVTLAAGLLAGIAPAWRQTQTDIQTTLREGGGHVLGSRNRLRNVFLVGEVALALALLVGAGLMIRSFSSLVYADRSIAPDSLLTLHIDLPNPYSDPVKAKTFCEEFLRRLQALSGVQSAALISGLPYSYYDEPVSIKVPGRTKVNSTELPIVMKEAASPDYFRTLRMTIREGRNFDSRDDLGAPAVAIVSESMAHLLWPSDSPIGKTMQLQEARPPAEPVTVVGVVTDTRHEIFDRSFRSILYLPVQQAPSQSMDFVLRTTESPLPLLSSVRSELRAIDSTIAIENPETMTQKIAEQTSGLRYVASLMAFFGAVALILAAVGIYGVGAHLVNERRREIGIRMALGAQSRDVLAIVLRSGLSLVAIGLAIGIALSLALTRLIASLIYGVGAWDLTAFALVTSLLTVVALLANYIPARRAMQVDPVVALRDE